MITDHERGSNFADDRTGTEHWVSRPNKVFGRWLSYEDCGSNPLSPPYSKGEMQEMQAWHDAKGSRYSRLEFGG
jgi:hypothetical protein